MEKHIHPNYIKSSNLILGTVALGLINFFFTSDLLNTVQNIVIAVLTLVFIAGIGYIVRQGKAWVRYLLLVLTVMGLIGIPSIVYNITLRPVVGLVNIAQAIMQIWAMVLLFMVPKSTDNQTKSNGTVVTSPNKTNL